MTDSLVLQVSDEVEREVAEDDVGLWEVARSIRRRVPQSSQGEIRLLAAEVCLTVQSRGISLGQYSKDGDYLEWPNKTAIDRMVIAWTDLGRDPDIGEIAWLRRSAKQGQGKPAWTRPPQ